jgi:hypothetical protein
MTENATESSKGDIRTLNARQALELLDLEGLLYRTRTKAAHLGWERLVTGLNCYDALTRTGVFGSYREEFIPALASALFEQQLINVRVRSSDPEHIPAPFAQSAAFLDMTSEWINCEDLYSWYADPLLNRTLRAYPLFDSRTVSGFYRYIDLAVDIFHFFRQEDASAPSQWFAECFAHWFDDQYTEKAISHLKLVSTGSRLWEERKAALYELRRMASSYVGDPLIRITPIL